MFQLFHFWWPHSDSSAQCLGVSPEKGHEPDLPIMPVATLPPFPVLISLWSGIFTKTVFFFSTVAMTYGFLYSTQSSSPISVYFRSEWMPPFLQIKPVLHFHHILFWFVTACVVVFVFKHFFWPLISFIPTKRAKVFAINYIPQL